MLTAQGHRLTAVLDGGIQAWIDAGHPLSTEALKKRIPEPAGVATSEWSGVVPIETVEQRSSSIVLIDSRAPERYRGETEPVDAAAGHIPGATNLPDSTAVEAARFLDPAAQQQRFLDAGIDSDAEVIVHCGSGVTACRNILAAEIAGLRRPLLYVGSWSDWSAAGKPVATGQDS